jgi:hypothetical protein
VLVALDAALDRLQDVGFFEVCHCLRPFFLD